VWITGNEVLAPHLKHGANGRPVGWSTSSSVKNYSVLKYSLRTVRLSSLECFNTHILLSPFDGVKKHSGECVYN
jgi:hypothetical protein